MSVGKYVVRCMCENMRWNSYTEAIKAFNTELSKNRYFNPHPVITRKIAITTSSDYNILMKLCIYFNRGKVHGNNWVTFFHSPLELVYTYPPTTIFIHNCDYPLLLLTYMLCCQYIYFMNLLISVFFIIISSLIALDCQRTTA